MKNTKMARKYLALNALTTLIWTSCDCAPISTGAGDAARNLRPSIKAKAIKNMRLILNKRVMVKFLSEQKYRLDLGFQVWPIVQFSLLIIAASDKLLKITGLPKTWMLLLISIPAAFLGVWLVGYILDKLKYMEGYIEAQMKRNPSRDEMLFHLEEIKKMIGGKNEHKI